MFSKDKSEKSELEFSKMKRISTFVAILALFLALLSCRPVIAIGWPELIILALLIAILLGPVLFRLYRFLDKVQKASQTDEKKKK
jgi:hypothetical protein